MITQKIALKGMKGRKKSTILFSMVLSLTFLFIIIATTLQTSITKTKEDRRLQMYGDWEAAYMSADDSTVSSLTENKAFSSTVSRIVGTSNSYRTVGTINDQLIGSSNFTLLEGNYPENDDQVVLESSIANSLGLENPIGQVISLDIITTIIDSPYVDYVSEKESDFYSEETPMGESIYSHTYKYHTVNTENKDGARITVDSNYIIVFKDEIPGPEDIVADGYLYNQTVTITKDFTISGVVQTYSESWDRGSYNLANTFISESCADKFQSYLNETALTDSLRDYRFPSNVFLIGNKDGSLYDELKTSYLTDEELESENTSDNAFRRNSFSYPVTLGTAENSLTFMILGIIFIASVCAIFQIFLTQMKKRTRKLALLKSIGTTNFQIFSMLMWEGIYELAICLPAGTVTGLLLSYGTIQLLLNNIFGLDVSFYLSVPLFITGLITGCVAMFLGMLVPMIMAMRTPLTGAISTRKFKHKKSAREIVEKGKTKKRNSLSFSYVSKQHEKMNYMGNLLSLSLSFVIVCIIIFSTYLAYSAFDDYRTNVDRAGKPAYQLTASHGLTLTAMSSITKTIKDADPDAVTDYYKYGEQAYLYYEDLDESTYFNNFKESVKDLENYSDYVGVVPEPEFEGEYVQEDTHMIEGSIITTIYGLDTSTNIYSKLKEMLTKGSINDAEFLSGQTVILLIPLYDNNISTYNERYKNTYSYEETLEPGDTITVSAAYESAASEEAISYYSMDVTVGGIIYYYPDKGIWPFSEFTNSPNEPVTVITSAGGTYKIYPQMASDPVGTQMSLSQFNKFFLKRCPHAYGHSAINIYADCQATNTDFEATLFKIAGEYGMSLINYNETSWAEYYKALNSCFIIILLGISASAIGFIILININMSAFEQERPRIGVLQSMGITIKDFQKIYFIKGIKNSVLSLIFVHLILTAVIIIENIISLNGANLSFTDFVADTIKNRLYNYPYAVHIILCIIYIVITALITYMPAKQLKKYSPIENINASQR